MRISAHRQVLGVGCEVRHFNHCLEDAAIGLHIYTRYRSEGSWWLCAAHHAQLRRLLLRALLEAEM